MFGLADGGRVNGLLTWALTGEINLTQESYPHQTFDIIAKNLPRLLENGRALVWAFSMQWKPRDGDIRFSSASNAFSSCAEIVVAMAVGLRSANIPIPLFANPGDTSLDGFVKSRTSALPCILRHRDVL